MATISELWLAFGEFQNSVNKRYGIDDYSYYIVMWTDGEGELHNADWDMVARWDTFDEGVEMLNELARGMAQNGND